MQLGKKINSVQKEEPKKYSKVYVDWDENVVDYSSEIEHGKHKGKTLGWVKANDEWYYNWMCENGLIENWGLYKPIQQNKKQYAHFLSHLGEYWIGFRETNESGKAAPNWWYE